VELTGFPDLETLLSHPIDASYSDLEDRRRWRETMQRDGVVRGYENRNVRYDGTVFWVRDSGRVIRNAAGEPLYYQGTLEDITEQKRAEERLRQSEDQLRQSQKLATIGQLAGEIAHDFNNLLTVIQGNLSFGLEDYELDPQLRADLEEIRFAADRAAALTRKLLAFSRSQQAEPVVFEPARVAEEMAGMLRRVLGARVDLRVELDPGTGRLLADPGQLEQVLLNLAVNARDAMPEGGTLHIRVARADPERVLISVSDTGAGMSADVRERIFEPFFTTKPAGAGTGLGLSTVLGIVRQAGGSVEVDSAPGEGTTFRIYLPAYD
jgi:two-component system, cell cycle sensor histidine kinase and response regulator CckA